MLPADAVRDPRAGRFDVGVFMLAPKNSVIRDLAADSGLRLVPIREARAIANHLPFLRSVVLPRGIYNIAGGIPPNDTVMVAAGIGVVVRKDLHPYLIYSLLDAMTAVHRGPTFLSSAGDYPTIAGSQLPAHPLATRYYRSGLPWNYRELPPWPAGVVEEYLVPVLGVLLFGGICLVGCPHSQAAGQRGVRRLRDRTGGAGLHGSWVNPGVRPQRQTLGRSADRR